MCVCVKKEKEEEEWESWRWGKGTVGQTSPISQGKSASADQEAVSSVPDASLLGSQGALLLKGQEAPASQVVHAWLHLCGVPWLSSREWV